MEQSENKCRDRQDLIRHMTAHKQGRVETTLEESRYLGVGRVWLKPKTRA
jgi:hypothetical protein